MSLRADFLDFDDRLASHGVPPLTAWWREGIGGWLDAYETGHVLDLTACVGRGAAKSFALYKLAMFFSLFGSFAVPVGERHYAVILSRLKEEAEKGPPIIAAWLSLLGVGHKLAGDVIELDDMPRAIRVVAASVQATSGWRAYFVGKDERSKWPSGGVEELDSSEVDTSASAMTATHSNAPRLSFGSAWGDIGPFHEAVKAGSDESRIVLGPTPTWIAAPHIREEDLRRKERDPGRFAREYECVFQSGRPDAELSDAMLLKVTRVSPLVIPRQKGAVYVAAQDPANRGGNAWTVCVARATTMDDVVHVQIVAAKEWRARRGGALDSDATMREIAAALNEYGITQLWSDQWSFDSLKAIAGRHGIELLQEASTAVSKVQNFDMFKRRVVDRTVELPDIPQLRQDLTGCRKWIAKSGTMTLELERRDGRHCDFSPSAMLAVSKAVAEANEMPGWATPEFSAGVRELIGAFEGFNPQQAFAPRSRDQLPAFRLIESLAGVWCHGVEPLHRKAEQAEWSRSAPTPVFSPEASDAFKTAVRNYLSMYA